MLREEYSICKYVLYSGQDLCVEITGIIGVNGAGVNVSASHARGPWSKPRRLHSPFLPESLDFVPIVVSRGFP